MKGEEIIRVIAAKRVHSDGRIDADTLTDLTDRMNGSTTAGDFVSRIDYSIAGAATPTPTSVPTATPTPVPTATPTPAGGAKVNDNNSIITYSGMNYSSSSSGYINSDCHYSNIANVYGQYIFMGTSISWIGSKNTDHGYADVYIDGALDATVDTYAASGAVQQTLYTKTGLAFGFHTIKIVVKNTKNASSSNYYQDIDAFTYN